MVILQEAKFAPPVACPYREGQTFTQEYFFAHGLDESEFDGYLSRGWRRFGLYFFRPRCEGCAACLPVRVSARELAATKSQRRVIRKNSQTRIKLRTLEYRDELFEIYRRHSRRFDEEERDARSFRETYFCPAVPAFQSEYYIGDQLAAVGFLDRGASGFSSVYFCYDPAFSGYSLGTYSVLAESFLAAESGLDWYYLGYYVADCSRMAYKGRFAPRELMDWEGEIWR